MFVRGIEFASVSTSFRFHSFWNRSLCFSFYQLIAKIMIIRHKPILIIIHICEILLLLVKHKSR